MYDYFELVSCMRYKQSITINGYSGLIRGIEMEDGSGKCFNVKLLCNGDDKPITLFVRLK